MRPFLILCTIVLLILVDSGCARPAAPEGTLRVGIGAQPATLDPQLMRGLNELKILSACYEGLVIISNSAPSGVEAGVAKSWEISDDGLTYTFHLRENAKWSDGKDVVADEFVWGVMRGLTQKLGAVYTDLAAPIVGAKAYTSNETTFDKVGYKALDKKTIQITLSAPSPVFLRNLASPFFYPLRRDIISQGGDPFSRANHWASTDPFVSNGPFVLEHNKIYRYARVVRNPFYWDHVGLDAIEFYPIENRSAEEIAFLSGELDVTLALPVTKVNAYKTDTRLRIDNALQVEMVLLNTKRPPLDSKAVRTALSLGLNRKAICEDLLKAGQAPAWHLVPNGISGGYKPTDLLTEDVETAQAILGTLSDEQHKQLEGLTYRFNSSEARKAVAETLQAQWSKNLNIPLGLENMEWKSFLQMRSAHDFDMIRTGWSADVDDPSDFLNLFVTDSPNNHTGWSNADYDAAVVARDFSKAEAILMDELPVIPLFFAPNVYLINPRVNGWEPSAMDMRPWKKVWVD